MDERYFKPHELNFPRQQKSVDPDQLQKELQRAFDVMSSRINTVEALAITQIQLHKMTLRIFLDLEMIELDPLIAALEALRSEQTEDVAKTMLAGMIDSFNATHGTTKSSEPHLRLVPLQYPAPSNEEPNQTD